jgi:hypothetical protein
VQLPRFLRTHAPGYRIRLYGEDAERAPADFDADSFIASAVEALGGDRVDGVASSSDYPGCLVASFIAHELGLRGPHPESILHCAHKYYARMAQQIAVPEATPDFMLIDPDGLSEGALTLPFPLFVKPVKSWFSQHARRVDSFEELSAYVRSPTLQAHLAEFVRPFNQLLARFERFHHDGRFLLAEQVLLGKQVTLEGFVSAGVTYVLGIVDSVMYPGTLSFARFDYPSSLSRHVAERMADITHRAMAEIGFDQGLFNAEFIYDEAADTLYIVEINPRMCGQFADMMEAVNGTNTYAVLFSLALGDPAPEAQPGGAFAVASSFVLRSFADATVADVPDAPTIEAVEVEHPVTLVKHYYRQGERLSGNPKQFDGRSYRYAVVNMSGPSRAELMADFAAVRSQLDVELVDITG